MRVLRIPGPEEMRHDTVKNPDTRKGKPIRGCRSVSVFFRPEPVWVSQTGRTEKGYQVTDVLSGNFYGLYALLLAESSLHDGFF